jgi:branched-chain amino acid aminotransferase
MPICYLNEKFVDTNKAKISINDLGFLRGFGVFDLAAIYNGRIFLEDEHLARLQNSAKLLGLELPYSISKIKQISQDLIVKNKSENGLIRWVLTGGVSTHFVESETFAVLIENKPNYPERYFENGIKVITTDLKRELPRVKSLNYQIAYSHYPKMAKAGAFEMIYTPNDQVLEATTSNVFIIENGKVYTPKNDMLLGITRQKVIELCKKNDVDIFEHDISKKDLFNANEVFITATTKKVMPVIKIDDSKVGTGKPGPMTRKLIELFNNYISN